MLFEYICSAEKAQLCSAADIGGKAGNLAWLSAQGYNVPHFFVIRSAAFQRQLEMSGISEELRAFQVEAGNTAAIDAQALLRLRENFLRSEIFASLSQEIAEEIALREPSTYWAVRSSVSHEDGQSSSFAGQFQTVLFQSGRDQICIAIKQVWSSLFNSVVAEYARCKGIALLDLRVAVIVQEMVSADKGGVTFTANPVNGNTAEMLISSTFGLGEGVVSGACDSDEFVLDNRGELVRGQIAAKTHQYLKAHNANGIELVDVNPESVNTPSLNDKELRLLWSVCTAIAEQKKTPQDIEWCFRGDHLYILQTRPITAKTLHTKPKENEIVWDNSNIQESYCGVTTPLTFSFAQNCYTIVYSQLFILLGVLPSKTPTLRAALDRMLGIINGRVFYNINSWYSVLCFLPGFSHNKADMERMMGLTDPTHFEPPIHDKRERRKQKLIALRAYLKLLICFIRFDRHFDRFTRNVKWVYDVVDRKALAPLSVTALLDRLDFIKHALLGHWQAPIINDFLVMMLNGACLRILEKGKLPEPVGLLNELLAGQKNIASTEPTKRIIDICKKISRNGSLTAQIKIEDDVYLYNLINSQYPELAADIEQYISLFGDRVIGELKLETVTLREAPEHIIRIFRAYLADIEKLHRMNLNDREEQLRSAAEMTAFNQLERELGRMYVYVFKRLVSRLRRAVKDREEMRLERSRAFGLARTIYLAIGREFARLGVIEDSSDIFFLTEVEITDLTKGLSYCADIKRIVDVRRGEFARFLDHEPAHHFYTYELPTHNNSYEYPYANDSDKLQCDSGAELKGIGCYPGIVTAPVKIVLNPEDCADLGGKILCAVRTDPGWTPLFPTCSGLIVERGSTLSHSAVVARELGIPAIVNVPNVTRLLHDDEKIVMDGGTGIIRRPEQAASAVITKDATADA